MHVCQKSTVKSLDSCCSTLSSSHIRPRLGCESDSSIAFSIDLKNISFMRGLHSIELNSDECLRMNF